MRSKLLLLVAVVISGAILTLASVAIARKSPLSSSQSHIFCSRDLRQVDRGFPLHFITLKPSVSLCQPVDQLSVLWEGNAYHKEFIVAAAVDFVFWSGLSAAGLLGFMRYRQVK
jgi:hypothetical protein